MRRGCAGVGLALYGRLDPSGTTSILDEMDGDAMILFGLVLGLLIVAAKRQVHRANSALNRNYVSWVAEPATELVPAEEPENLWSEADDRELTKLLIDSF